MNHETIKTQSSTQLRGILHCKHSRGFLKRLNKKPPHVKYNVCRQVRGSIRGSQQGSSTAGSGEVGISM